MATKNRRVAAYLPPDVDEAFIAFKVDRGLATAKEPNQSDSQALIVLLSEFLGVGHSKAYSSESEILERLSELEEKVTHLSGRIDENQRIAEDVKSEVISELRSESPSDISGQMSFLKTPEGQQSEQIEESSVSSALVPQNLLDGLSGSDLSKRFGTSRSSPLYNKNKGRAHFLDWSQKHDPDDIPWEYRDSKYYPVTED